MMKTIVFLILMFFTFYAAGMYQYRPLMFLFVAECFYMISAWMQVRYLKMKRNRREKLWQNR